MTGHAIEKKNTAARYKFQFRATKLIGRDHRPRDQRVCLKSLGVRKNATEADKGVDANGRDAHCTDQRGEGDRGRQNGTEQQSRNYEHHSDRVVGLSMILDPADPARERKDAITSHNPYETRRCHTRDSCIHDKSKDTYDCHENVPSLAH